MKQKKAEQVGGFLGKIFSHFKVSMRRKLIATFVVTKIIPIATILIVALLQISSLGTYLQNIAVEDATLALNDSAVEDIERMSTDTAQRIADFLYQRDHDVRMLAELASDFNEDLDAMKVVFERFVGGTYGRLVKPGEWVLNDDGTAWVPAHVQDMSDTLGKSTNTENNDTHNGSSFHTRPAEALVYEDAPLYDEVTFVGLDGKERIKIGTVDQQTSRKKRYKSWFQTDDLRDVSNQKNTFIGAETYWPALGGLTQEPGNDIYVSDVIGAYVGSNYIGMYTPDVVEAASSARGYDIDYAPEQQAYAGQENPNGQRFEGIVRWASPVYADGEKIGYVTFALNHDHIMEFVDHQTPMTQRYTEIPSAFEGNYAFIWDYQCRSIAHPRHHSIVGFDPETGLPQIPWLPQAVYLRLLKATGLTQHQIDEMSHVERLDHLKAHWAELVTVSADGQPVYNMIDGEQTFHDQARTDMSLENPLADDPEHIVAADLTRLSTVGLDGRYLNNAPQCTGWMDIVGNGGSGSLYILWSGIYKLNTAAAIPYYTGQYAPSAKNPYPRAGFGFVAIGAGLEDFTAPADAMAENLNAAATSMTHATIIQIVLITLALIVFVIVIAVNLSSFITKNLDALTGGVTRFKHGEWQYRFRSISDDEFGLLAKAFNDMADSIDNSYSQPLVITDLHHRIIYANKQAIKLTGKSLDELVGALYEDNSVYPPNSIYCPIAAMELGEEAVPYFVDELQQYFVGNANYFLDNAGRRAGYIIESSDVTEIQQAKNNAEEATLAKSRFLSNMSHEIRTPMNSIMGFAELALDYTQAPQARDYLNKITDNTKQLLHIINDILDISKVESGKMELENIPFDLPTIFERCHSTMQPTAAKRNLDLHVYAEPMPGKKLLGDPVRLHQVLMNLLANAVKFTPDGMVRLSAAIKHTDQTSATFYFEVKDEGIGMSDEQIQRIFDPFMQADSSTTRNFGGTGLGLPITKSIIELMGSEMQVESKLGAGSTFSFDLTFDTIDASDLEPEQEAIVPNERPHFSGLVLVCEDNHMNQQLITDHLARVGLQTMIAENGKIGVERVQERLRKGLKPFDLILMDMLMPVMDGMEAASRIIELNTGTPIIAVTANVMTSELERYRKNGISDCVGKPFTTHELWRCLLKYLKPVSLSTEDKSAQQNDNEVLLLKLKKNFLKNNRTRMTEITNAIDAGDFALAHRIAHTLKGNAGLIGMTGLQTAAAEAERVLKEETVPSPAQMQQLDAELNAVLEALSPLEQGEVHDEQKNASPLSRDQLMDIFNQLEPLLRSRNPECLTLLETIRGIPGAEALAVEIEKYNFKNAMKLLEEIKLEWM